ncbi:MAG: apolipoprotein N-acyltransferase [Burkholderiales bacterium]|nr:apolipoprotein N-acyltransferase [Burkholderiales bacterium]
MKRAVLLPARFALQLAIAFASGGFGVLAFAPLQWWPLALVSMFFLFALWHRAGSVRRAFAIGFAWGLGLFLAGVPWIYVSLHVFGGMPVILAAIATFLFCCYLSIFPALACVLHRKLVAGFGVSAVASLLLVMPACFVIGEYVRGWFFSGFPWLVFGYSQTPGGLAFPPLIGYAPVIGAFGISWLLAMTAGLGVLFMRPTSGIVWSRRGRSVALGATLAVWAIGGALHQYPWSAPKGAPLTVALLQGNIEQSLKWREDQRLPTLNAYREMVEKSTARLIVLPETALPVLHEVPADYLAALKRRSEMNGGDAIVGTAIVERDAGDGRLRRVTNSAVSIGSSPLQRYDKQHLVVFGEFIPPLFSWVYQWLKIPVGSMDAGSIDQKPMQIAGHAVAVNICYEDAFGPEIARQLPEAELLVNISNMAWFGNLFASDQQAQFSQMRALETGRWILRSTNTGVTAAINEKGEIVKALPQFVRGTLEVEVQPRAGTTPYVLWQDRVILGLLLLALAVGCALKYVDRHSAALPEQKQPATRTSAGVSRNFAAMPPVRE